MSGLKHLFIRLLLSKVDGEMVYVSYIRRQPMAFKQVRHQSSHFTLRQERLRKINRFKPSSLWGLNLSSIPSYFDQVNQRDFSKHGSTRSKNYIDMDKIK